MQNLKQIIVAGITLTLLAGGAFTLTLEPDYTYQTLQWERPTTDEGWNKESVRESLNIRSDEVLNKMLVAHKEKLGRMIIEEEKIIECPECIEYEYRTKLRENYNLSARELDREALKQREEYSHNFLQQVEVMRRSIEIMENEIRMRKEGFVQVSKEKIDPKTIEFKEATENKIRIPL